MNASFLKGKRPAAFGICVFVLACECILMGAETAGEPKTATVAGWGYNAGLLIVKNQQQEIPEPVLVPGLDNIAALSAGGMHNLALKADGTVYIWGVAPKLDGLPNDGNLAKVPELDHVVAVAAGLTHDLAVKNDGSVWTWGINIYGEMGKPSIRPPNEDSNRPNLEKWAADNQATKPQQIAGLTKVISAVAGDGFSAFLKADGTVWTCGVNTQGQLGYGPVDANSTYFSAVQHPVPTQIPGLSNIVSLAAGDSRGNAGEVHVMALDAQGAVWAWGVGWLTGANQQAEPSSTWLMRDANGQVKYRGVSYQRVTSFNGMSQNDSGGAINPFQATPVKVWGLPKIKAIAASSGHSLALSEDGKVYVWGGRMMNGIAPRLEDSLELDSRWDMLKRSVYDPNKIPPRLTSADSKMELRHSAIPIEVPGLERVAAIAVNRDTGYAVLSDGSVKAWGLNDWSTLGNGKTGKEMQKSVEAVRVANLVDASGIAAAGTYALVIRGPANETYLKWYLDFSRLLKARLAIINHARAEAAMIAVPLAELRAKNLAICKVLEDSAIAENASKKVVASLKDKLARQSGEVRVFLERLDKDAADADKAAKDILDHLGKGFDKYGSEYLQDFLRWKKKYEGIAQRLPFELAIAAGDKEKFHELAVKNQSGQLPNDFRVLVARRMLSFGDLGLAMEYARSAVRIDPGDRSARDAMREIQIVIISCAMNKSQEAIGQARNAFESYLTATGYPPRDYRKTRPVLVRLLMGPLDETNREESWALIVHGVVNVCDRVAGRLQGEEMKLDQVTREMTQKFLGLHMIRLLLNKKYSMEEIVAMLQTPDGIAKAVPLTRPDGSPYTQPQINGLRMAMKWAMEIPEVAGILDPAIDVNKGLAKAYFDRTTVADTAIDSFGASLISNAILMAIPMAEVAKVGQETVTVAEMLGQATRWNSVMEWVGTTRAGELMLGVLEREQKFSQWLLAKDLNISFVAFKGGQLVAVFMLQNAVTDRAEKYGGTYLAAYAQALMTLATDPVLLAKCLRAGQISKQAAIKAIDNYVGQGEKLVQQSKAAHDEAVKLAAILDKKGRGETLTPEESNFLRQRAETVPADHIPNGSPLNDGKYARKVAAEQGQKGVKGDGKKVTEEFDKDSMSESSDMESGVNKAKDTKAKINEAPPTPPTSRTLAYNPAEPAPGEWGGYEKPPTPIKGKNWAKAEEAMAQGDYDAARDYYDKAVKANEIPDDMVDMHIARADEAAVARAALAGRAPAENAAAVSKTLAEDIPPGVAEDLLVTRWTQRVPLDKQGGMSTVSRIPGEEGFVLKEIVPTGELHRNHLLDMGESEVVASVLARELGIPFPAVAVRFIRDAKGEIESVRLLIRRIHGEGLHTLSSGELFQYRKELSEHKAFAHLISDYDRKLDNFMRCAEDGKIYYLDAGMGDIRSNAWGRGQPEIDFTNRGILGIDHWYVRGYKFPQQGNGFKLHTPGTDKYIAAVKVHLAERSLTYNDAKPAVDRILELARDESRLTKILKRAYQEAHGANNANVDTYVKAAIDTLKKRAARLEEMMKALNERNGRALPGEPTGRLLLPGDRGSRDTFLPVFEHKFRQAA